MTNYSKLYWLTRLDYLQGMVIGFASLVAFIYMVHWIVIAFDEEDTVLLKGYKRALVLWTAIILIVFSCLIPTKNEAILIMAGGKTLDYVQSDTSLNKMPYQATKIISDYLQKQIDQNKK